VGYIWGCVLIIIMMGMLLLLGRIWSYVYLQRYHSFVIFVYLHYVCGIVQVYLVIGLSFQCVMFLVFGLLCYMYVLCQVYVEHILSFVCFYAWICSLYRILNARPVCPTYLSGHSLHFYWCTPFWLYMCIGPPLGFRWFRIVLVVLNVILMLVFLNNFVIVLVLGP
jgi:hypothetical protein